MSCAFCTPFHVKCMSVPTWESFQLFPFRGNILGSSSHVIYGSVHSQVCPAGHRLSLFFPDSVQATPADSHGRGGAEPCHSFSPDMLGSSILGTRKGGQAAGYALESSGFACSCRQEPSSAHAPSSLLFATLTRLFLPGS